MNYLLFQRSLALGMAVWLICAATGWAEDREVRPFRIRNLEGERFDSRQAAGPVVLSFFFTRCPPCIREMPALHRFMQERGATARLLFVDPYVRELGIPDAPDHERQIRRFVRELGLPETTVYFDELGTLASLRHWSATVVGWAKYGHPMRAGVGHGGTAFAPPTGLERGRSVRLGGKGRLVDVGRCAYSGSEFFNKGA